MFATSSSFKVYLGLGATDMRKSINSLAILISEGMAHDPLSGHLFAFCNGRRNILKILYWDRNGFCLWHKRLEKDKFHWPRSEREVYEISGRELRWLIEGLDINKVQSHGNLDYQNVY